MPPSVNSVTPHRSPQMQRLLDTTWPDPRVEDIARGMHTRDCQASGVTLTSWDNLTHVIRQVYRQWAAAIVAGMPQ